MFVCMFTFFAEGTISSPQAAARWAPGAPRMPTLLLSNIFLDSCSLPLSSAYILLKLKSVG